MLTDKDLKTVKTLVRWCYSNDKVAVGSGPQRSDETWAMLLLDAISSFDQGLDDYVELDNRRRATLKNTALKIAGIDGFKAITSMLGMYKFAVSVRDSINWLGSEFAQYVNQGYGADELKVIAIELTEGSPYAEFGEMIKESSDEQWTWILTQIFKEILPQEVAEEPKPEIKEAPAEESWASQFIETPVEPETPELETPEPEMPKEESWASQLLEESEEVVPVWEGKS